MFSCLSVRGFWSWPRDCYGCDRWLECSIEQILVKRICGKLIKKSQARHNGQWEAFHSNNHYRPNVTVKRQNEPTVRTSQRWTKKLQVRESPSHRIMFSSLSLKSYILDLCIVKKKKNWRVFFSDSQPTIWFLDPGTASKYRNIRSVKSTNRPFYSSVCGLVSWPLSESEVRVDFVLI